MTHETSAAIGAAQSITSALANGQPFVAALKQLCYNK
jgi:hypothetical protein